MHGGGGRERSFVHPRTRCVAVRARTVLQCRPMGTVIIALDGPAGSGKSSVCRLLASRLGAQCLNTGSFYRAFTLAALRRVSELAVQACSPSPDPDAAVGCAAVPHATNLDTSYAPLTAQKKVALFDEAYWVSFARTVALSYRAGVMYVGEENVESLLRSDEVESAVSYFAAMPAIRAIMTGKIRSAVCGARVVCEGRDLTTVVFVDADLKCYLDASIEARVARRWAQGTSRLSKQELEQRMRARDAHDRARTVGGLRCAPDALYVDTSCLTIEEVCERIAREAHRRALWGGERSVENQEGKGTPLVPRQLQERYSFEAPEPGSVRMGTVVQVNAGTVFVDIGGKSEGRVPVEEFEAPPKAGDGVRVYVERVTPYGPELSKTKADRLGLKVKLRDAERDGTPVEGRIVRLTEKKSGFEVDLGAGMMAFLPISQSDCQKVDAPESLIGLTSKFYIERISQSKQHRGNDNIVINRRRYLEERARQAREEFFNSVHIEDSVSGVVKSFTSFGAFIDLGGFDGLLHVNDMSWGHVARPREFVKKGQTIELKVIRLDQAEKRINLSLKHFQPDPWLEFENKFGVNDVVKGRVTKIADFGAFIELAEGIEGLAHISEFSWVKKTSKPSDMVKIGDEVECMILGYDIQAGRVSLGLKQVTANPWEEIEARYPVGARFTRRIVKVTNAGAFIEMEEGIDGFLHVDDLSWVKRTRPADHELEVGKEIECMVIECDPQARRIRLGVKQLSDNPWQVFANAYGVGSTVEGEVSSVTDFGIFVRVPGGVEGLVRKQHLVENRDGDPGEALRKYAVGDRVKAVIVDMNVKDRKVAFSVRDYQRKVQRDELSRYMSAPRGEDEGSFTLGDLMRQTSGK
ncbi:bifunctional cytidylate kinase/ribosomal protein S1 [Treponema pallidum subsp. pertenue]|uniref:30S ribosomal protein S1 n=1 Tax=Treponema pallidum TaxID=160 RepID=UPI00024DCB25|nr:bifunctional cytidylate kinase/ribosomal protein S1 [Treponema pallidum subsp. pertenue str. SamoaD]AEZ58472.1 bifunctional cytidylate kinase/ribosomal protein S1 [Treponema pallidum subsp. pertenue str. CDC2]ASV57933.1 bifunctional cytidylate kinase/ribosomal protein S1 [Treponema pallidum subsp. pertenue]ASV58996.1 bifunctional cytidylate kinase/ribosomal protein S1 [Treponema pallidum subsp. pertenue]AYE89565.1 bifunctional cytidylate kinase/ribosomal protein S1 [Treponema pallidum subsp.